MRITVLLFARLRELAGRSEWDTQVAANATIAEAWQALVSECPSCDALTGSVSAAVNAEFAPFTHPLAANDEVAFLPPVSGG